MTASGKIEFDCPVCGSTSITQIYSDTLGDSLPEFGYNFGPRHGAHYRIVRCGDCSHVYCTPRHPDIFRNYVDVEDLAYLKNQMQRIATALQVISRITKHKHSGRLLDIGCSTGDFLNVAKRFFSAEGLELSSWAADAAQRSGLKIHRKQLAEFEPDAPYDVITLWGVIEHFEHPLRELAEMDRLLKPGGIVCLWTGDFDSIFSKLLGERWWYIQGQHIQYFTRRSIECLFRSLNYELIDNCRYPYVMSFEATGKSLARYPAIGWMFDGLVSLLGLANRKLTFRLPGEMFLIFRKPDLHPSC
jgi:SAM-dependent methyltransferase